MRQAILLTSFVYDLWIIICVRSIILASAYQALTKICAFVRARECELRVGTEKLISCDEGRTAAHQDIGPAMAE